MRVVPDTNVLVSAIVFGGPPEEILLHARQQRLRLIISSATLDELRRTLRQKFDYSDAATFRAELLLREISDVVDPLETIAAVKEDPTDNRVLEAAIEGKADAIVSGDAHLLRLRSFRGVPIWTVRGLLEALDPNR
ncbi:MAG: putative toxin-antitoxin system toxin component, PIN family [bacterium]